MSRMRKALGVLAGTPFHPQWLVGRRKCPAIVSGTTGLVLDIGAGDRWIQRELPAGATYVALDYPATGLGLYNARPDILADATSLPLQDGCVDLVVCLEVIEHVRRPDALLAEVARVLRRGGIACLSMPFLYPVHDAPHDYQRWTSHGWLRSIAPLDLEVVEMQQSGSALECAGLLLCLALAAPLQHQAAWKALLLGPFLIVVVPVINIGSWVLGRIWPSWTGMSTGYYLELRKR